MTQNPLKMITDRERSYRQRVTSSKVGNLLMLVQENQGAMVAILGERCTSQVLDSPTKQAICGLATHAFNLMRSADILVSSGYAVQSLTLVRAVYEAVIACVYYRSRPEQARAWLDGKSKAMPEYASVAAHELEALFDEYTALRRFSAVEQTTLLDIRAMVPKVYGLLSRFTHPYFDVMRHQTYIDRTDQLKWMSLGPDLDERVAAGYSLLSLAVLNLFQIMLEILLLLEFREAHLMKWEELASTWERVFFAQAGQLRQQSDAIASFISELETSLNR